MSVIPRWTKIHSGESERSFSSNLLSLFSARQLPAGYRVTSNVRENLSPSKPDRVESCTRRHFLRVCDCMLWVLCSQHWADSLAVSHWSEGQELPWIFPVGCVFARSLWRLRWVPMSEGGV